MLAAILLDQPNLPNYRNLRAYEDYARAFGWSLNKLDIDTKSLLNWCDYTVDLNFVFSAQVMPVETLKLVCSKCLYQFGAGLSTQYCI